MAEIIDVIVTKILPIVSALVTIIGLFKGWVLTKQALFEQREKLSKHSYEIYKISGDESLKNLSVEYGYAAITKESFLTLEQRKALIQSRNPTRDIDSFIKCRHLLTIETNPLRFKWKASRFNKKWYFYTIVIARIIGYVLGSVVLTIPFTGSVFMPSSWLTDIYAMPPLKMVGITLYCFIFGGGFSFICINGATKLLDAYTLIKRHSNISNVETIQSPDNYESV